MAPNSTIARLRSDLAEIKELLVEFIGRSPVLRRCDSYSSDIVIVGPEYYFDTADNAEIETQMDLKERYKHWHERFNLVFHSLPPDIVSDVEITDRNILDWIELNSHWELTGHQHQNAESCRRSFDLFGRLLQIKDGTWEPIVVPDTNALISAPDPRKYKDIATCNAFTFVLLPEVLRELDDLKNFARDTQFRNKVKKVVRRIGGWRKQGSLIDGVTLHKSITVRAIATEPRVRQSLSWLDEGCNDDRVIASVLELQAAEPQATIWLVTSDINLHNKCDLARIPSAETPR